MNGIHMEDLELSVAGMPPETIDHYWEQIQQLLDETPETWMQSWTKESIYERIKDQRIQVWAVFNGRIIRLIFFTQRYVAPNGIATLQIFWMFGTGIDQVLEMLNGVIDKFAAQLGCSMLEVIGRPGWERKLSAFGAKLEYICLSRPVLTPKENS